MTYAGRVHDPGHAVEASAVQVRDREVEGSLVQQLGQELLVEFDVYLAPPQRHLRDRAHAGAGRDPDAPQRRDHAAPRSLREVEAGRLRREEVGDVAGDQRARGRHADEDRAGPGADRAGRLLAERGVGLVADHDGVRRRDAARVADEPLVGLDGDWPVGLALLAVEQRGRDSLGVAAVAQLAVELVDEVPAVREDQHPTRAGRLDEAHGRDRLAGAGRVLEPEALVGVRVVRGALGDILVDVRGRFVVVPRVVGLARRTGLELLVVVLVVRGELVLVLVLRFVVHREHRRRGGPGAVGGPLPVALGLGKERRERARERVDLVGAERRPVGELRLLLAEQALEPEQERIAAAPLRRWNLRAAVDLCQGHVQRAAASGPRGERDGGLFAVVHEALAGEALCPLDGGLIR